MDSGSERSTEPSTEICAEATKFIHEHAHSCETTDSGKIRFKLTGMEFPGTASRELLQRYLVGKAMRRAQVEQRNSTFDFRAHSPWIVPHKIKKDDKFLWCRLTERTLPRDAKVIQDHVNGRRFKAALKKAEADRAERLRIKEKRAEKAKKRKAAMDENAQRAGGKSEKLADTEDAADVEMDVDSGEDVSDADSNASDDVVEDGSRDEPVAEDEEDEDVFWLGGRRVGRSSKKGSLKKSGVKQMGSEVAKKAGQRDEANTEDMSDSEEDEWGGAPAPAASTVREKKKTRTGQVGKSPLLEEIRPDAKPLKNRSKPTDSTRTKRKREKSSVPKKARRPSARVKHTTLGASAT